MKHTMNQLRRVLAMALALLMLVSCLPTSAIAEIIAAVDESKPTSIFGDTGISTIALLPGEADIATYEFYNGTEQLYSRYAIADDVIHAPATPTVPDGQKFLGWKLDGTGDFFGGKAGAQTYTVQPGDLNKTFKYYATFAEIRYVDFYVQKPTDEEHLNDPAGEWYIYETRDTEHNRVANADANTIRTLDNDLYTELGYNLVGWSTTPGGSVAIDPAAIILSRSPE